MKTIVDYAEKVKAQHALNKTFAPVETDLTDASQAYAIGDQFIYDGVLYKAKTAIAQHDALVLNTNYEAADDITTQIKNKTVTTDPVPTEGSTNPVQSNGVYVDNRNIYEVMGKNGAKNKEPFDIDVVKALNTTGTWTGNSYELNGITFAFADDGKVTVSGTASALCSITISGNYDLNGGYIITGCPSGGGGSTYSLRIYDSSTTLVADDVGEGVSFTANNLTNCRTNLIVRKDAAISTPIVFAPMIRDSKDTDPTYQPYAKTNQELTAENEALMNKLNNEIVTRSAMGAKNIFSPSMVSNGGNYIASVSDDGSIIHLTNPTANSWRNTRFLIPVIPNTNYRVTAEAVYTSGHCSLDIRTPEDVTIAEKAIEASTSVDYTFNSGENTSVLLVVVLTKSTSEIGDITFNNTMIRLATDADSTFQPYAKTNQELTAENQTLTTQLGDITQLGTTDKSSAVAAINEVNTALGSKASTQSVTDLGTAVDNKHKVTIKTVSTSGWASDTTSQSGTTLYKKSISLNHVYVESPAVDIATSSGTGLPTTAQQTAYDLLQYVTVDGTTLYLYASAIPSTQFYIGVEGVD